MKITSEELENCYYVSLPLDGFTIIQRKEDGPFQYVDPQGNISKEYYYADSYIDGFALVQKEKGRFQYRDTNGNLSEEFSSASEYSNGFAIVRKEPRGKYQYRNKLGELSTQSFVSYNDAIAIDPCTLVYGDDKKLNIDELSPQEILANLDAIKEQLNNELQRMLDACSTIEEADKVVEFCEEQAEYIKSMAYEAHEVQKRIAEYKDRDIF